MNKILAVGAGLTLDDCKLITKMITAIFGEPPRVFGIEEGYTLLNEELIIAFGEEAALFLHRHKPRIRVEAVPHPSRLYDVPENEDAREWTWNILNDVKNLLDQKIRNRQSTPSTKETLPPIITANDIDQLGMRNSNIWVGTTDEGKSIRLSAKNTDEGSEDIKLTFAELYALKVATELLGVKEFQLVPSNKNGPNTGK